MDASTQPWWKDAVVYQIYPASFKDSNNDGIGDIPGITQSLDYIQSLGCNVLWICPMYASPQVDMGYDISDYEAVYPPYGTMQDMNVLIEEVHRRGLRIILDLVVNHTSDQHAWFKDSRTSKDNPKRDWYIWQPAKYDSAGRRYPPNNWRSNFGGSVWEWDEQTQEYYLHLFCPEQPDLNWQSEDLRQSVYQSAMISWLERGIDGFRIDTVNMYSKPPGLPDAPVKDPKSPWQEAGLTYCNGPYMDRYLEEMNEILGRYDAMSVGECPFTPARERVIDYVSAKRRRLNMVFQFDTVDVGMGRVFKYVTIPFNYTLADIKQAICRTQGILDGTDAWTTTFIENHDQARSVSRFGDDSSAWRCRSAKMLALVYASLSGTLFVYQGQEIGMINMPAEWPIDEYKDVDTINYYNEVARQTDHDPTALKSTKATLQHLARDHSRTPMQWTSAANAGFTSPEVTPWMRVNTSASEGLNVDDEETDTSSVLNFWRQMLQVRKDHSDLLVHGSFEVIDKPNPTVFSFAKRSSDLERCALVVCNFSGSRAVMPKLEGILAAQDSPVLTNLTEAQPIDAPCDFEFEGVLEPWEGRLYIIQRERQSG